MSTYKTFKQLENKILKEDDKVIFKVNSNEYEYLVNPEGQIGIYLEYDGRQDGLIIFESLGIDDTNAFVSTYFGYEQVAEDGFPEAKQGDYAAITRLALALFAIIEGKNIELDIPKEVVTIETSKVKVALPRKAVEIELNGEYTVKILESKIVVGCQSIPKEKVLELFEAAKEYWKL